VLSFIEAFPTLRRALVMVQLEVAQRLAAPPGSKTYGIPSLKAAWYAEVKLTGTVSRTVFWPSPNVDSGLVTLTRREPPRTPASRKEVFACIDAAFAQRRKTLRAALAGWAGSAADAETTLRAAGVDPRTRGEQLDIHAFAAIAAARPAKVAG
jgi:16S rRNA (adenine1518-N6/adenine1519-N6)-dimethyltransferase